MKYLSIYLIISLMLLGNITTSAQNDNYCPDIEWMRFFNNTKNYTCLINHTDSNNNQIIWGRYGDSPALGAYNFPATNNLMLNGFIGRVDSAGNPLWIHVTKTFTYGYGSFISSIVDNLGYIYATINFKWKTEFAGGVYQNSTNTQAYNTLLVKLNRQGQVMESHLFYGAVFSLIHVDDSANYYCSAATFAPILLNNQVYTSHGGHDVFIFKLNNQFQLQWAQQVGGVNNDDLTGFAADGQDNLYLTGNFASPSLQFGSTQLSNPYSGINTIFLAKLSSAGSFLWAKNVTLSSSATDCSAADIALDNDNNIYIAGSVKGAFAINGTSVASTPIDKTNSFVLKYTPSTNQYSAMTLTGGDNSAQNLLFLPNKELMVLSGRIDNSDTVDFSVSSVIAHNGDFYVAGIGAKNNAENLTPQWVIHSRGSEGEIAPLLTKDFKDNMYLSGRYGSNFGLNILDDYTFPPVPGNLGSIINGYQAKLAFLSDEVMVDSAGVLSAVQDSVNYQWLDCGNGMQPIAGATGQSFSPTQPGSYAVQVSNSFCSVVSDCINTTGISAAQQLNLIRFYPNPVQQKLHIKHLPLGTAVAVFDVLGRMLYSATAENNTMNIDTHLWTPGIYMLRLSKNGTTQLKKVLKE